MINPFAPPTAEVADVPSVALAKRPIQVVIGVALLWFSVIFGPVIRMSRSLVNLWNAEDELDLMIVALVAVASGLVFWVWLTIKILSGRNWARMVLSAILLLSILFSVLTLTRMPTSTWRSVFAYWPTLVRVYALSLFFVPPGKHWFVRNQEQ